MPAHEQEKINSMREYIGDDIRGFYKENRNPEAKSDYELNSKMKMEYTTMAIELAKQYGLRYFSADNDLGCVGCSDECCGTEVLRNYKLWRYNSRSRSFKADDKHCEKLENCICNFIRGKDRNSVRTIKDIVDERLRGKSSPKMEFDEFE
jgi:hypothetical protein